MQWKNRPVEESTWEKEADMQERYPHLFTDSGTAFRPCIPSCDRSGTNDGEIGIYCNDLFSRFEEQILFLEKLAETMDPTMDRHGHDGPSRGSRSKTLRILKFGY